MSPTQDTMWDLGMDMTPLSWEKQAAHTYLLKYSTSRSVSSISTPSKSLGRNTSSRKTQPGGLSAYGQASGVMLGALLPIYRDCPPPHGLVGVGVQPLGS